MNLFGILGFLLVFTVIGPAWAEGAGTKPIAMDAQSEEVLNEGIGALKAGRVEEAINEYFNKVLDYFGKKYADEKRRIYCARTPAETLNYLTRAAADKESAIAAPKTWAYAFFMKGYALMDLRRGPEAKPLIERAVALSPNNAQFLSELGQIHQSAGNWPKALETFQHAEESARDVSPPETRGTDLSRAMRGVGFALIELGRLDEAEKKFRQCLELNKGDQKAIGELKYIQNLREKKGGR